MKRTNLFLASVALSLLAIVSPSPGADVVSIWGGARGTIVLKSDGTVWTWGANFGGKLYKKSSFFIDFNRRQQREATAKGVIWLTVAASAQPAFIERKSVSPTTAAKIVDACIARAEQQKQIVGCAVVDIAGVLIDFHTMGGQATFAETAILKAKTAAHWQRATSALEDDVNSKRNGASVWIGDFPRSGGVPIMIDGQVAGAIGVGGGNSEELAKATIEAVLGKQPQSTRR